MKTYDRFLFPEHNLETKNDHMFSKVVSESEDGADKQQLTIMDKYIQDGERLSKNVDNKQILKYLGNLFFFSKCSFWSSSFLCMFWRQYFFPFNS